MTEDNIRNQIIETLQKNNWYGVLWSGHTDRYFACLKRKVGSDKKNEIYSAIYESYYDLVNDDEEVLKFSVGYDCKSWDSVLKKLNEELKNIDFSRFRPKQCQKLMSMKMET